jgi:hypothetical protein
MSLTSSGVVSTQGGDIYSHDELQAPRSAQLTPPPPVLPTGDINPDFIEAAANPTPLTGGL